MDFYIFRPDYDGRARAVRIPTFVVEHVRGSRFRRIRLWPLPASYLRQSKPHVDIPREVNPRHSDCPFGQLHRDCPDPVHHRRPAVTATRPWQRHVCLHRLLHPPCGIHRDGVPLPQHLRIRRQQKLLSGQAAIVIRTAAGTRKKNLNY